MKTIFELLAKNPVKGDVGVEIEVEGDGLPTAIGDKRWEVTTDGSLRGGYEYVFKKPLPVGEVKEALEMLSLAFKLNEAQLEFSFRTSVHVHVNVGHLSHPQICAFMYGYLLLEEVLMTYCGRARKGNRFCLRLNDAEGLGLILHEFFQDEKVIHRIGDDQYRYAAMNIEALTKFCSLEFRGMEGNMDVSRISTWCNALTHLRDFCADLGDPMEVLEKYNHFGPQAFFERALGVWHMAFKYPRLVSSIQQAFSITLDLPYAYLQGKLERNNFKPEPKNPWLAPKLIRRDVGQFVVVPGPNVAVFDELGPMPEWLDDYEEAEE